MRASMRTMTSTLLLLVTLAASAPTSAAPDTTVILRPPRVARDVLLRCAAAWVDGGA
jgi:hypothetical protein